MMVAAGGPAAAAPAEEKTEFTVELTEAGANKNKRYQSCPRSYEQRLKGSKRFG